MNEDAVFKTRAGQNLYLFLCKCSLCTSIVIGQTRLTLQGLWGLRVQITFLMLFDLFILWLTIIYGLWTT